MNTTAVFPRFGNAEVLRLRAPLNLYQGLNPDTGEVNEAGHPDQGASWAGRLVLLPGLKGASGCPLLVESVRLRTAPRAIVTPDPDPVLLTALIVVRELYGATIPVFADGPAFADLRTGDTVTIQYEVWLTRNAT